MHQSLTEYLKEVLSWLLLVKMTGKGGIIKGERVRGTYRPPPYNSQNLFFHVIKIF